MDTTTITIDGVLDRDLVPLLKNLGILERVKAGQMVCSKCDKPVTLENLGAIRIQNGQVAVNCDDLGCIGEEDPA